MLTVAVTGHRPQHLAALQQRRLQAQATALLGAIAAAAAPRPACLVSALAEGADRQLARAALRAGMRLAALLPFAPDDYLADFSTPASRREFQSLLARAEAVRALPGERRRAPQAYAALGEALLDGADLLLAVWDGAPARGPGGTAAVVADAWRRRLPVLHLCARSPREPSLLLAPDEAAARTPCDPRALPAEPLDAGLLAALCARPAALAQGGLR